MEGKDIFRIVKGVVCKVERKTAFMPGRKKYL
jgi:hypothetical protein